MCYTQFLHSALQGLAPGLAAVGVSDKAQRLVKTLHARCVIVGDECGFDAVLFKLGKPRKNTLVWVRLFVRGKGVVNINEECAHTDGLQKCRRDRIKRGKHIIGGEKILHRALLSVRFYQYTIF